MASSSVSRDHRAKAHLALDHRRSKREQGQRTTYHEEQEDEDEYTARRVGGEGMHRGQHPGAHQKVPSRLSENAAMASSTVQLLNTPRFSVTASEWISAVPTSHGMKEAFSTGSQNHQPPQPNS